MMKVICERAEECKANTIDLACEHASEHEAKTVFNGHSCTELMDCLGNTSVRCIPVLSLDWDQ